jgi:DNA-binding XRE family transcriptional regulator
MFPGMARDGKVDPRLGPVLKKFRDESGLTQEALGPTAGITTGTLSKIETGQTGCTWMTVVQIIDALGVTLSELAAAVENAS